MKNRGSRRRESGGKKNTQKKHMDSDVKTSGTNYDSVDLIV